jgi:glutamate-1-semialdehyde 2,1-aminomutase
VAASLATLKVLRDGKVQGYLADCTEYLRRPIDELSKGSKYGVRFQGIGGKFQILFADQEISNYREALVVDQKRYDAFRRKMMAEGLLFHPSALFHHGITSAHSKEDLSSFIEKLGEFLDS